MSLRRINTASLKMWKRLTTRHANEKSYKCSAGDASLPSRCVEVLN
jgi:hypothetical protein